MFHQNQSKIIAFTEKNIANHDGNKVDKINPKNQSHEVAKLTIKYL